VIDVLEMSFLGAPEILCGGRVVKFATRKALALFTYLVVEPGNHPREKLQAIFWPESETRLAQAALRNTLARMRAGLAGVDHPFLMEANHLGFNRSCAHRLDLDLVAQAGADPKMSIPTAQGTLLAAVQAGRGPFLEAFSLPDSPDFNDWILIQRRTWGNRLNLACEYLSTLQLESHQIQPAIETANRWLSLDPLNEKAYRCLIRLHVLNGDRSAALQTYQTCYRLLADELGLEPSFDFKEMSIHLPGTPLQSPLVRTQAKTHSPRPVPFVGRSMEYHTMVEAYHQARTGNPRVVVISGEPGVGKTHLAREFLNWAITGSPSADILGGNAYEMGRRLPYQPMIDALRVRLDAENAPEDLLDDTWLVELTRILPELRARYPDLAPVSCEDPTTRTKLFEAIARLGTALANQRPLILFLDDMQWVEEGTLELLHYLARGWQADRKPVLMVFLIDQGALSPGSDLETWLGGLGRTIPITSIPLAHLWA
jgi:DNA-binding SARP family transcriptional activator